MNARRGLRLWLEPHEDANVSGGYLESALQLRTLAVLRSVFFDCSAPGREPISALSRYAVKLKTTDPSAPHCSVDESD